MVICLEQGADLHMAQLVPLPLTVSCFSKIQIGFIFLVPVHPGSLGKRAVKRVCVCVCGVWKICDLLSIKLIGSSKHDDQHSKRTVLFAFDFTLLLRLRLSDTFILRCTVVLWITV